MPQAQTTLGSYGAPATFRALQGLAPIARADFALQVEGLPQQFPAPPQAQEVALGNAGFQIVVQMLDGDGNPIDVSAAQQLEILLVWPDGSAQSIPAKPLTNGTDGSIAATPGALSQWGLYYVFGVAQFANQTLQTLAGQLWYKAGAPL